MNGNDDTSGEQQVLHVKGHTGQVEFDGEYVTILRKGFLARTSVGKGEKRLHIAQIAGVQWKPAGFAMNGFIQFSVPGGVERRSAFGSQTNSAVKDENSVLFTKQQQPEFEKLRAAVDKAISQQHSHPQQPAAASVADELAKLADLRDKGVISADDFEAAKNKLLGG